MDGTSADSRPATLERELAALLGDERRRGGRPPSVQRAAIAWSEATWEAAQLAGPAALTAADRERALRLATRPVFVCGAHRSGTTLIRDLLDEHPALAMLPSEGTYFGTWSARLDRPDAATFLRDLTCEWLRRLADPTSQPQRWTLGRSGAARAPYVEFARAVQTFDALVRDDAPAQRIAAPLLAVALAFAWCRGGGTLPPALQRWGEKSPGNERWIPALLDWFPEARVVQVVRDPVDVLASRRAAAAAAGVKTGLHAIVGDLRRSLSIASAAMTSTAMTRAAMTRTAMMHGRQTRHLVVRYEDLVAEPEAVTRTIADLLGIEWTGTLLRPTVAGQAAASNTSCSTSLETHREGGRIVPREPRDARGGLDRATYEMLIAAVAKPAAALGYSLPALRGPRRWLRRLQLALRPRL